MDTILFQDKKKLCNNLSFKIMNISIKEHSTVRYLELGQFQLNRLLIKFYDNNSAKPKL